MRLFGLGIATIAAVIGALILKGTISPAENSDTPTSKIDEAGVASAQVTLDGDTPIAIAEPGEIASRASDRVVASFDRDIRITDLEGAPVPGAELTVNALNNDVTGSHSSRLLTDALWLLSDRNDRIRGERFESVSSPDGLATVPEAPPSDPTHGATLWVTHTRYRPTQIHLPAQAPYSALPTSIALKDAAPAKAVLFDGSGNRIQGATVFQLAALEAGDVPAWTDRALMSRRALLRTSLTDESGAAALQVFDGPRWTWATTEDGLESQRRLTESHTDIELTIPANATASGTITSTDGTPIGPWAMVSVESRHRTLGWRATSAVPIDGRRFTNVSLPLHSDSLSFRFRVIAGDVLSEWVVIDPPAAGSTITVDLPVSAGLTQWFYCHEQDDLDTPIEGARIQVSWLDLEERAQTIDAVTASTGYAEVAGLPINVKTRIEAESDLHRPSAWEPLVFELEEEPASMPLELLRAPAIEGRVTLDGDPVEEFIVHVIPTRSRTHDRNESYAGRKDGTFRLPGVAVGSYEIIVNSPAEMAQSLAIQIDQTEGGLTELEIGLQRGLTGVGHVADASTGHRIESQLLALIPDASGDTFSTFPWVDSADDGSFEIQGISRAHPKIGVVAEGYEYVIATPKNVDGDHASFGQVNLHPARSVSLELSDISRGNGRNYGAHWATETNGFHRPFDDEGKLKLTAMLGRHVISLRRPSGTEENIQFDVSGSPPWRVEIDTCESSILKVEFIDSSGNPATGVTAIDLSWKDAFGSTRSRRVRIEDKSTSYTGEGVSPGSLYVNAYKGDRSYFDLVEVESQTHQNVRFVLDEPVSDVVFVDSVGQAIHPISAVAIIGDGESAMSFTTPSSPDGVIQLSPNWLKEHGVGFYGYENRFGTPTPVSPAQSVNDGPIQIKIDADASLDVTFSSTDGLASNVELQVLDARSLFVFDILFTDDSGRLDLEGIGPGSYMISCIDRRYLPAQQLVHTDGISPAIELFPYATVDVRLIDSQSTKLQDVNIELRHIPTGDSTRDWIARGWTPDFAHRSDGDGIVRLSSIAAGAYELTAHRGSVSHQVEILVPVRSDGPVDVVLGE